MDVPQPCPAAAPAGGRIAIDCRGWRALVPGLERVVGRALRATGIAADVILTDDRTVRRLNADHRAVDRPTNVLTFAPPANGWPGEIVLALGVVRREAAQARRRPAHHLSHLIVHGALHVAGHDHHHPGDARRMELEEARLLSRIGVPSPWRIR